MANDKFHIFLPTVSRHFLVDVYDYGCYVIDDRIIEFDIFIDSKIFR